VVDAVASHATVLPLRLATVYRDRERVREVLRERDAEFRAALERLDGRAEWGVKVYAEPEADAPATAADEEPAAAGGRAYLQRRLRERHRREDGLRRAGELARRIDEALRTLADDARHHRAQDPKLSGARGQMVLNAAYLVPRAREHAFTARVRELAARETAARVELTGPWAPYSFTPQEDRAGGRAPA
jgi:hypothetical protein